MAEMWSVMSTLVQKSIKHKILLTVIVLHFLTIFSLFMDRLVLDYIYIKHWTCLFQKSKENPVYHDMTVSLFLFFLHFFSTSHTWSVDCCVWKQCKSHKNNIWLLHASCSISITTPRPLKWSHHHTKGKKNIDSNTKLHRSSAPISVITPYRTLSGESCLIIHVVCSVVIERRTQEMKSHKS